MKKLATISMAVLPFLTLAPAMADSGQQSYVSASNWTGPYIGAEIGGGVGTSHKDFNDRTHTGDFTVSGVIGGGTAGYNKQWGKIVTGLEGDFSDSGINGSTSCPNHAYSCETNTNWLATLRPRVGYALGNFMPYVTAGLAAGDINVRSFLNTTGSGGVDNTKTQIGWTAGAGLETSVYSNWSVKAEYLYIQLADTNVPSNTGLPSSTKFDENVIRVGLNYSFK